jgi:hypothetical protein
MDFFYLHKRWNYERNILLHGRRIKEIERIRLFKKRNASKASADIAEARDKRRFVWKCEYDAAKEAQEGMLELKLQKREVHSNATIDEVNLDISKC